MLHFFHLIPLHFLFTGLQSSNPPWTVLSRGFNLTVTFSSSGFASTLAASKAGGNVAGGDAGGDALAGSCGRQWTSSAETLLLYRWSVLEGASLSGGGDGGAGSWAVNRHGRGAVTRSEGKSHSDKQPGDAV